MSKPVSLQRQWNRMVQDVSRDALPRDAVWNMVDIIPGLGSAPASVRSGWAYSPSASPFGAGTSIDAITYAPFSTAEQVVVVDNQLHLLSRASGVTIDHGVIPGITVAPRQFGFMNNILVIPASTPQKYTGGGAPAALGGAPPANAAYVDTYKGRMLLATASKIYFSAVGNPESWDTANAWIQSTDTMTAIAALKGAILLFSRSKTERIRGDSPPPSLGMVLEPAFDVGCSDPRSIAKFDDKLIFAGPRGVFLTDGATISDLTMAGGISEYWRAAVASTNSVALAGTYYRGYYIVTIKGGRGGVASDCLACKVDTREWFRLSNITASMFTPAVTSIISSGIGAFTFVGTETVYAALWDEPKVMDLTRIFDTYYPTQPRQDGDGTGISPLIETGFYRPKPGSKRARRAYLSADVRSLAGLQSDLTIGYATDPSASSYVTAGTFPSIQEGSSTGLRRRRVTVADTGEGFAFSLSGPGANMTALDLYELELELRDREGLR